MAELTILESLDKTYRQKSVERQNLEKFKKNLSNYYIQIASGASDEEKLKGELMDFLKFTFYAPDYNVSPDGKIDCAIHLGNNANSPIGVIFEVKTPISNEMIIKSDINNKALQEILLYYLRERVTKKNFQLKYMIVTNIYEFYIFDAHEFEKLFYSNAKLVNEFSQFEDGSLASEKTDFFYKEIAAKYIDNVKASITYTYFDIHSFKKHLDEGKDKKLIDLYKVLSPINLLKIKTAADNNSLNTRFYSELLYIMGLEETLDQNSKKRVITRKKPEERIPASIIENTISILDAEDRLDSLPEKSDYGETKEDQLFNVALTLSINWINRILFLKLLEAQLIKYHKGDSSWAFMKPDIIKGYDELNRLFFKVLAKKEEDREPIISLRYNKVPYLNSSLFELSSLERQTIVISNLDDREMPILQTGALRNRYTSLPTLRYLLNFLDAYDFSSESPSIIHEEQKTLINASVLGLIFEKINGHKDGAVFTPGSVTMFMSRKAIRSIIVKKFNDEMGWNCADYEALKNKDIDDFGKANEIIDSLKIGDIAVGSGHFLVSVLNEIIYTKFDLGILLDTNGCRIKKQNYNFDISNDELIVTDEDGVPFNYIPGNQESQRIQEALFFEKKTIIENCLFGVDINPNAVNICRLRLWIELLKNAYYTKESNYTHLETLPNIDINIKAGNSLIHRFALEKSISEILNNSNISIEEYKRSVTEYKNTHSKDEKKHLDDIIDNIKSTLKTQILKKDPIILKRNKIERELSELETRVLFVKDKKQETEDNKRIKILHSEKDKIDSEIAEIKSNITFKDAFEWRIEFPEVLDKDGNFIGFDLVIGNPPYIQLQKMASAANALDKMCFKTFERTGDIYCLFYEYGMSLLKPGYLLSFITSNKWMRAAYGEKLRHFLSKECDTTLLIDFAGYKVFDNATVDVNILNAFKRQPQGKTLSCSIDKTIFDINKLSDYVWQNSTMNYFSFGDNWTILSSVEQNIKNKIEANGRQLKDWNIKINFGIKTGFNEAFIIDKEKKEIIISNCKDDEERKRTAALIRPILRGRDINKYSYNWANLYLIWIPWHFPLQNDVSIQGASQIAENMFKILYPSIYNYLLKFKPQLSSRNKSETGIRYEWYALQRWGANYWDEFSRPKILWKRVGSIIRFAYDESGI